MSEDEPSRKITIEGTALLPWTALEQEIMAETWAPVEDGTKPSDLYLGFLAGVRATLNKLHAVLTDGRHAPTQE